MALTKPITFDAKGATFTVALQFAGICHVEETLDQGFPAVLASLQKDPRFRTLAVLFQAILLKERPEVTEDDAVSLIEEIGPPRAAELIAAAVAESTLFKPSAPKPARAKAKAD